MSDPQRPAVTRRESLLYGTALAAIPLLPHFASAATPTANETLLADGRDQPFDADWRFFRGDGAPFAAKDFNESGWRLLDLPHDWSIEDRTSDGGALNAAIREIDTAPLWKTVQTPPRAIGPFNALFSNGTDLQASEGGPSTGFTVGGIGWYRKRFRLPALATDARVEIVFDGVYMNSEVWLNGVHLGAHPNGYTPFAFDLTPHLNPAGENVLAVRVANIGRNSRWYSGSGIYRPVRLSITGATRFARWGVAVMTPDVSAASATVKIRALLEGVMTDVTLVTRVRNAAGRIVAEARANATAATNAALTIAKPDLWSPKTPTLYQAECTLYAGDRLIDRVTVPLGIRRVEIDAAHGLRINGEPYKLRGGCVHHDNGLLGAAAIDRAEERRVELLKARGFNAIRTSHNPPSVAFLDACDRLGMLVVEEAFDTWREGKNVDDYNLYFDGWWQQDLAAMVARDGNHPSVILWSIGNEIPEKAKPQGIATAKMLADEMRRLDPTRPITAALPGETGKTITRSDGTPDQTTTQFLDVAGYNYKLRDYERDHALFPARIIVGTESLPSDVDAIWRLTERSPYLIGDFVWTAMDYLGEAGIGRSDSGTGRFDFNGAYPWFNANCGDIDLIGRQKPQSLLRDVVWGLSPLEICVQRPLDAGASERVTLWGWRDLLQSWSWPGAEARPLNVHLYTRGDRVELTLDGKKVGEKALVESDHATAIIAIPYAPGKLVATAFRGGRVIGRRTLETAGPAAALRLKLDRPGITATAGDLGFVTVETVDSAGRPVPDAVNVLKLEIDGPLELAAFGNANPRGVASFQQPVAKSWHGCALAIVRPTGSTGTALLKVSSAGLAAASVRIGVTASGSAVQGKRAGRK